MEGTNQQSSFDIIFNHPVAYMYIYIARGRAISSHYLLEVQRVQCGL
jgi:hypothetical protein